MVLVVVLIYYNLIHFFLKLKPKSNNNGELVVVDNLSLDILVLQQLVIHIRLLVLLKLLQLLLVSFREEFQLLRCLLLHFLLHNNELHMHLHPFLLLSIILNLLGFQDQFHKVMRIHKHPVM